MTTRRRLRVVRPALSGMWPLSCAFLAVAACLGEWTAQRLRAAAASAIGHRPDSLTPISPPRRLCAHCCRCALLMLLPLSRSAAGHCAHAASRQRARIPVRSHSRQRTDTPDRTARAAGAEAECGANTSGPTTLTWGIARR
jgi:hypothetical protein